MTLKEMIERRDKLGKELIVPIDGNKVNEYLTLIRDIEYEERKIREARKEMDELAQASVDAEKEFNRLKTVEAMDKMILINEELNKKRLTLFELEKE